MPVSLCLLVTLLYIIIYYTHIILQVSFNPQDSTQICVSGNKVLKLFRYTDGVLKQSNGARLDTHHILSHAWVSRERLIAGTESGRVLGLESGDLRWEMSVTSQPWVILIII